MDTKVVLLCIALIFVLSTNGSFRNCFKGSKGQKGGASAGIIVGCLMAFTVIAVVIGIFVFGKKDPTPSPKDPTPSPNDS